MAYKVSYKVVSEQGEQLKNIAKDMDTYSNTLNQIISKLGSDELLQSVRSDLKKFGTQLDEEKTVLNLAGQVITDVVQSYTGAEKKTVQKVDKAKAHNRDFYKRAVAVASAGGVSAAGASAASMASASASVNVNAGSTTVYQEVNNVYVNGASSAGSGIASSAGSGVTSGITSSAGAGVTSGIASSAGAGTTSGIGPGTLSGLELNGAGMLAAAGVAGVAGAAAGIAGVAGKAAATATGKALSSAAGKSVS